MTPTTFTKATNVNTDPNAKQVVQTKGVIMRQFKVLMTGSLLTVLVACQAGSAADEEEQTETRLPEELTSCPDKRPEICTQQYDPVCGYFQPGPDDGVSSSSREWATASGTTARKKRTFGNACSACIEKDIIGFVRGECSVAK